MAVETKPFRELTGKEKLQYFWDYYKFRALALLLVLLAVPVGVHMLVQRGRQVDLYCLVWNDISNQGLVDGLERYPSRAGRELTVSVDNGYPFNDETGEAGLYWPDDSASIKLMSLEASGQADVVIADTPSLLFGVYREFAAPLEEALPGELLRRLEPYYVYAEFEGEEGGSDGKAYGLDLSGTDFYKENGGTKENAVLFLPYVSERGQAAADFVRYVYGM